MGCIHVDSISTLGVACCTLLGRVGPLGAGLLQRGRWDRRGGGLEAMPWGVPWSPTVKSMSCVNSMKRHMLADFLGFQPL